MSPHFTPRRLVATLVLLVVAGMIVLGLTVLNGRMSPAATLVYWGGCLLLTLGAIVLALMDLLRTLAETRRTQRELANEAIEQIEREAIRQKPARESR